MRRKFPSIEQWKKLYELANLLDRVRVWQFFSTGDIITIYKKDDDEPYFCTILERDDLKYTLGIYKGKEGMRSINYIFRRDVPYYAAIHYHNSIFCHFQAKNGITKENLEVIEKLNIEYETDKEWISFTTQKTPYASRNIDKEECDELIFILYHIKIVMKYMVENMIYLEEYDKKSLTRYYDTEKKEYVTDLKNIIEYDYESDIEVDENDETIIMLQKTEKTEIVLEYEITSIAVAYSKNIDGELYHNQICLLFNHKTWKSYDVFIIEEDVYYTDDITSLLMSIITTYIIENGRPETIIYRDDRIIMALKDYCNKLDINMLRGDELFAIDSYMEKISPIN